MRFIFAFIITLLLLTGLDIIYTSELYNGQDFFKVSRLISLFVGGLALSMAYLAWDILDFQGYIKEKLENTNNTPLPAVNLDLLCANDVDCIEKIRKDFKNKKNMIAYTRKGPADARNKALKLGIWKCFIDYKSSYQMEYAKAYV